MSNEAKRHIVYSIKEGTRGTGSSKWVKVGTAFVNRDGSMNVYLDALPIDGKLHIRAEPSGTEPSEPEIPPIEHFLKGGGRP